MKYYTPGPVQLDSRVLNAVCKQVVSHRSSDFRNLMTSILELLKEVYKVSDDYTITLMTGSGTLAVEAMAYSLTRPHDKVLLLEHGEFGERLRSTLVSRGCIVRTLKSKPGEVVGLNELLREIERDSYKALFIVHTETSTGASFRMLREVAEKAHENNMLVCIDAVSSLAGEELRVEEWGLDAVASCSQKCIGAPPGLSFVALSEYAVKNLVDEGVPLYLRLSRYVKYVVEKRETPFTPAVNLIYGLLEALKILVLEEGVENRIRRLKRISEKIYDKASEIGFKPLPKRDVRANTIVALKTPSKVKAEDLLRILREEYGVVLARGMGSLRSSVIRIGVMGYISDDDAELILESLEKALEKVERIE